MTKGSAKAFQKHIDQWVTQANEDANAIYRDTVQGVVDELQRNMPEDSGNLKRSVVVSHTMPTVGANDEQFTGPDTSIIPSITIDDDRVYVGIRAAYAAKDNYGYISSDGKNRAGKHWFERTGEPRRVCRRLIDVSYAATGSVSRAA